jgi:hypothetical protein
MKLQSITEAISRLPQGGIVDSTDRWDQGYLEFLAITYRTKLSQLIYQRDKRLNPMFYQKNWPIFEPLLQDNPCCVKFRHPEVMSLDQNSDGFRYVGTLNFAKAFSRVQSRSWLATFNDNPITQVSAFEGKGEFLYDGSSQILEIYGMPQFTSPLTECLFNNPLDVITYNKSVDDFPVPNNLIPDLVQMIYNDNILTEDRKPLRPQDQPSMIKQRRQKS